MNALSDVPSATTLGAPGAPPDPAARCGGRSGFAARWSTVPRRRDEVASGAGAAPRWLALITFAVEFVVSLGLWWSFDPANAGWQSVVDLPWIPSWGIRFTLGVDGIAVMMILLTTFIMLLVGRRQLDEHSQADAQLLRAAARAHDRHARRVHGARSLPVLRDVGSDARPDVLHRRHLGRRAAHLREPQVLHLHDGRIAAHARGDRLPRSRSRESGDRACRTSTTTSSCTTR